MEIQTMTVDVDREDMQICPVQKKLREASGKNSRLLGLYREAEGARAKLYGEVESLKKEIMKLQKEIQSLDKRRTVGKAKDQDLIDELAKRGYVGKISRPITKQEELEIKG